MEKNTFELFLNVPKFFPKIVTILPIEMFFSEISVIKGVETFVLFFTRKITICYFLKKHIENKLIIDMEKYNLFF